MSQELMTPEDNEEFQMFVIRHLGPSALVGDKVSIYEVAELAFAKGITQGRNNLQAAKPADPVPQPLQVDALGSLPVVARRFHIEADSKGELIAGVDPDGAWVFHEEHAAEIAKRDAEIEVLSQVMSETANELGCAHDNEAILLAIHTLRAQLAGVDGLVEALRYYTNAEVYKPDSIGRYMDIRFVAENALAKYAVASENT